MKIRLVITAMVFILAACQSLPREEAPLVQEVSAPPTVIEESTRVSVRVSPDRLEHAQTPEEALLEQGLDRGMAKIINTILNRKPLIQISDAPLYSKPIALLDTGNSFAAQEDPVTGDFSSSFEIDAVFSSVKQLAGVVVDLDDTRAIAAQNEYLTFRAFEPEFSRKGVYFLVGKAKEIDTGFYYEIIGSGKVIYTTADLSQAILMETVREVEIGDPIFLLKVDMEPVLVEVEEVPVKIEDQEETGGDSFVVQPVMEPEPPEEPAESK